MDHAWAAEQLAHFEILIDEYNSLKYLAEHRSDEDYQEHYRQYGNLYDKLKKEHGSSLGALDKLISYDPVMRRLMNAAQAGLGDYPEPPADGWEYNDGRYWDKIVKPPTLRAKGIHQFEEEAHSRMRPDAPDLTADQFHPWVWGAAAPLWDAGSRQEAVHAAARSVNARMQQKRGHHDKSDAALCREFFSLDAPAPDRPRLRFKGYNRSSLTWRSKHQGAMEFGAGCFEAIRNPAAHEHGLVLPEQVALEQLAAFSLLARWIDECEVEMVPSPPPGSSSPSGQPDGPVGSL